MKRHLSHYFHQLRLGNVEAGRFDDDYIVMPSLQYLQLELYLQYYKQEQILSSAKKSLRATGRKRCGVSFASWKSTSYFERSEVLADTQQVRGAMNLHRLLIDEGDGAREQKSARYCRRASRYRFASPCCGLSLVRSTAGARSEWNSACSSLPRGRGAAAPPHGNEAGRLVRLMSFDFKEQARETMSAPTVTVVIPTHARPAQLEACLGGIAKLDPVPGGFEIVIVDDGGPRSLEPLIAAWRDRCRYA